MDDYVAYHSTELMGHDYRPGEQFHFFSRKPESILRRAIGNRVWVVVGKQDAARTAFRLAGVFTPSEVRPESDGFGISGPGKPFRPSPEVTAEAWFRSLLRCRTASRWRCRRHRGRRQERNPTGGPPSRWPTWCARTALAS